MPAMLTSCDDDDEPSSSASSCDDDDEPSSSASSSYSGPYFGLRDCGKVISSIQGGGLLPAFITFPISFVYDGSGRVVKVDYVDSWDDSNGNVTVSYDYNSQTGKVVDQNGECDKIISFDADANGRFNSLTYEYSRENYKVAHEFKYNSDGNVISAVETHTHVVDGKWKYYWGYTYTLIWDGDLLTSFRCTKSNYDPTYDYEREVKITYSDVVNKYRTPLCGLRAMLFNESNSELPNEHSIAPAKLPKKIEWYEPRVGKIVYACRYTLDDEGFIEKEYVGDDADRYVDFRYTYADKEF